VGVPGGGHHHVATMAVVGMVILSHVVLAGMVRVVG
jgi:hypothetical protein